MRYRILGMDILYDGDSPYAYLNVEKETPEECAKFIKERASMRADKIKTGFVNYAYVDQDTGRFYNGGHVELDKYGKFKR